MQTSYQLFRPKAFIALLFLLSAPCALAVSFSMTPSAASPASVKPGYSFRVTYSYDVTTHPDFDADLGVQVRINMKKTGASSSIFRAVSYSGSTCGSRSNYALDWNIPKPYYGEYGAFDLEVTVSSADNGVHTIGTHVYTTASYPAAVTVQDDARYQAALTLTPSIVNLTAPERFNFEMTLSNMGSNGDSYDISLAGAGWTFHNLPYRPYLQAGQTRSFSCGATPPADMQNGQTRNATITLISAAKDGQVDQDELRATIRTGFGVENVRARQLDGTKHIEILYDLVGPADAQANISITATADGASLPATTFLPGGAVGSGIAPGNNRRLVWNAGADWDEQVSDRLRIGVTAEGTVPSAPPGMALIPGGTNSGTNPLASGESYNDWYPATYSLTVNSFYMDRYEVTKAKWDEVYTWAISNGYTFDNAGAGKAASHPVHTVSWYDVVKWCNARSQKEGRPAVYTVGGAVYKTGQSDNVVQTSAAGYRLPTDAEWEYAARGGLSGRRFPWGETIQHARANYNSSSSYSYDTSPTRGYHPDYDNDLRPYTSPVGSFAANGYGLYDMSGNVWEWCFDWYPGYEGSYRVFRGGGWHYIAYGCRVGDRYYGWPDYAYDFIGFRAVLPPGQ